MRKSTSISNENPPVKTVENQEEKLYLNKFAVKDYLIDNRMKF